MNILSKKNKKKIILVISDLHLGAGKYVQGKFNCLEDFHSDKELIDFLDYYSTGTYSGTEIELIINGDFLDMLAIPFVKFFDDLYWSEKSVLEKLKLCIKGHKDVFLALLEFLDKKNKTITYILGNHDAELVFSSIQRYIIKLIPPKSRIFFKFHPNESDYFPIPSVLIKHGQQHEKAHHIEFNNSIYQDENGHNYFQAPWGSYYVLRVINKYKNERRYINSIRPVKTFLTYGLLFDTLFTLRFIFSNVYYFIMVNLIDFFKQKNPLKGFFQFIQDELFLFHDFETITANIFENNKDAKVLIVGHTHDPHYISYSNGNVFINTGTWTKMTNLNLGKFHSNIQLTYAKITVNDQNLETQLNVWQGRSKFPYEQFI